MLPSDLHEVAEQITNELEDAIGQLHALSCAAHSQLLRQLPHYEATQAYLFDGVTDLSTWLQQKLCISRRTARQWLRVACSLQDLPHISAAYEAGSLSWEQVCELVKFATPEDDEQLVERAGVWNLAQLQAAARTRRRVTREETEDAQSRLSLSWALKNKERWITLRADLPEADGAIVTTALERIAKREDPADDGEGLMPFDSRLAAALVEVCSQNLDADFDGDRATLVVHVDAESLRMDRGLAEIVDGTTLSIPTALRLGCDAHKEIVIEDDVGAPIGIGRKSRQVPHWLYRQLRHRDRGCRYPGCGRTRWVNAHHIVHWAHGGPTDRENLVLLCNRHHRLLHEGGWKITGHPEHELRFIRRDGSAVRAGPPPLRPEIRKRLPLLA